MRDTITPSLAGQFVLTDDRTRSIYLASAQSIPAGDYLVGATVADFNADGKADLALADSNAGTLNVLMGLGGGAFAVPMTFSVGINPGAVVVGDFNSDGRPDLASPTNGGLTVLLGDGTGRFATIDSLATFVFYSRALASADLNGDAQLDLVVAGVDPISGENQLKVLFGLGDGSFAAPRTLPASSGNITLALADFNRDGKLDLATADFNSSGTVSIYVGDGSGGLTFFRSFTAGSYPSSLQTADFNGDDNPDLAFGSGATVQVVLGQGDGTFLPAVSYPMASSITSVTAADVTGDGILDLLGGSGNSLGILAGNGDGTFQPRSDYETTYSTSVAIAANFDSDPALDVAVLHGDSVTVYLNQPVATQFQVSTPPAPRSGDLFPVTVTAFDAYGRIDENYTGTVRFTSSDGEAMLPAQYTFTAADAGQHSFDATLEAFGDQTLTVTDTEAGFAGSAVVSIQSRMATHFSVVIAGAATAGQLLNMTVNALDDRDRPAIGYSGSIHFASTDGAAMLPADFTFAATDAGTHIFTLTLNTLGSQTVTITDIANDSLTGHETVMVVPHIISWDGGPTGTGTNWQSAENWVGDVLPGANDAVVIGSAFASIIISSANNVTIHSITSAASLWISGGTLTITSSSSLNNELILSVPGTLTGAGDLTVSSLFDWAGGTLSGSGRLDANGGMTLSGATKYLDGRALNNAGDAVWTGGNIVAGNDYVINNLPGATFDVQNGVQLLYSGVGTGTFYNAGIFRKSVGGWTDVQAYFTNAGTVDLQAGSLGLRLADAGPGAGPSGGAFLGALAPC